MNGRAIGAWLVTKSEADGSIRSTTLVEQVHAAMNFPGEAILSDIRRANFVSTSRRIVNDRVMPLLESEGQGRRIC